MRYDEDKPQNPMLIKESGWTVEEYQELPEDGHQYEIVDGKLELLSSPTTTHQLISNKIERLIVDSCDLEYIMMHAPVDVILSYNETRQPDILMIHRSRMAIIEEKGIVGPPDLVVEIISPSSVKRDRIMKTESYARFGVPEYWIADPANLSIEQYVLVNQGDPYKLVNVYGSKDVVKSEKIKCLSFVVKDGLTI
ncbi:MAG TPA: Uma2 family endonuclease [Bacilli bacterium]